MSELPLLERALGEAAQRRYGRPRWRSAVPHAARRLAPAIVLAVAVAAIAVGLSTLSGGDADERPATPPPSAPATTVNEERGYEITLPPGWQLAGESLTPGLFDPRELFSAGTFPLRQRAGECTHMPAGALAALGPADGFVSVQERGLDPRATVRDGYPPRPATFADRAEPQGMTDLRQCMQVTPRPDAYWIPFADAEREFYAIVVVGAEASERTRAEAFAILDSLRFDPAVQPDWRSANAPPP